MFSLKIKVHHIGCWGSDISLKFPKYLFSSIDSREINKTISHMLKVQAKNIEEEKINQYFRNRDDIISFEKISEDENILFLKIITKNDECHKNFSHKIYNSNCFVNTPTLFQEEFEIWTINSTNKETLKEIHNQIAKDHKTILLHLKEDHISSILTQKQLEAFNSAKYFGYYNWPRKISISQICSNLNISKTTFLSNLRKAESKILNNYSNE